MIVKNKSDLSFILNLQKIAFKSEAIKYSDFQMPPLTQTKEEIGEEFDNETIFFKYLKNNEIVGSVRANIKDNICYIKRLVVHPDYQKQGIGKFLMNELEGYFSDKCTAFELFTGEKSESTIKMYEKLGYKIFDKRKVGAYFIVYMRKSKEHKKPL